MAQAKPTQQDTATTASEATPLLGSDVEGATLELSFAGEVANLLRTAVPISAGYLLQNSIQFVSISIIGQLGAMELSIVASGFMIATCTAWLLAVGGTTAFDALGSRAIAHDKGDLSALDLLLQKCLLIMTVLYIPIAFAWCWIGPFLIWCGQSPELAYGTQTFLRCLAICAPGYIYFETLKKYWQCQNRERIGAFILLVMALIHIPCCWYVVHKLRLGLVGGVLATGSMYWLSFVGILAYTILSTRSRAWGLPNWELTRGLWPVIKLVLLGVIMVGAEWWAFELIAVAAGVMGDLQIAAQSILMTVDTVFALIPFGLGVATTNRVAYLLGRSRTRDARRAASAASLLAVTSGCFTMTMITMFRTHLSRFFSNDSKVIEIAIQVFPWGAAFQVADSLQAVNSGCLRGMARADIGASFNLVAYYLVALPLGLLTAFKLHWCLHGLWFGLATALGIVGVGEFCLVNFVPWTKYVIIEHNRPTTEP